MMQVTPSTRRGEETVQLDVRVGTDVLPNPLAEMVTPHFKICHVSLCEGLLIILGRAIGYAWPSSVSFQSGLLDNAGVLSPR